MALDGLSADGTSTSFVRADHKHALGPLATDLNFNEHEAAKLALNNLSSASAYTTTKIGVVYIDTVDRHPYVYTG